MLIEVKGTGFRNKGAELMLYAIIQQIKKHIPDADFAMRPTGAAPFKKRAKLGMYQKLDFCRFGVNWGSWVDKIIHPKVKKYYGLVSEGEIDVVLDASGLAYSDKKGIKKVKRAATEFKRLKKNGCKIIMLPQAFGPFETPGFSTYLKTMHKYADLIFAREKKSFEYLSGAVGSTEKIKIAPDFTNLLMPTAQNIPIDNKGGICVIPNYRMIDKTKDSVSKNYIPFLKILINELKIRDENIFLLIHESKLDLDIANKISESLDFNINIVEEDNPLIIKGIISQCKGVISSRFHGLVNALSTGVPSLATGWSHKYRLLFNDYDFDNGMLEVDMPLEELQEKLNYLTDKKMNYEYSNLLKKKSEELKLQSKEMWTDVVNLINS